MSNSLSEMIITKIHAFNRVNVAENATGGSAKPRERSAIAIKTEGYTIYESGGKKFKSDNTHAVILPKGSAYFWVCKQKGECL